MAATASTARNAAPGSTRLLVGLGLLAAVIAFLAGRWAADAAGPAPLARPAPLSGLERQASPPPQRTTEREWAARPVEVEPPAAAPPAAPARATPAMVAQATAEASAFLEASRAELNARCWPRDGLASGRPSTLVTFNVTFDPRGREIARGIGEDRKARAPELLRCLQKIPLGSLRISPTGANVGVRVAMRLP
jgi:hypothetical protein